MTTQKRWFRRGILWGVVLGGLVACAMLASPPEDLIAKNDHAALASFYEKDAAHLRQHAKDMIMMAEAYEKRPGRKSRGVVSTKVEFVEHCQTIAAMYNKAAAEADALAEEHRAILKTQP